MMPEHARSERMHQICGGLLVILTAFSATSEAAADPIGRWLFKQDHATETVVEDLAGEADLLVKGGIRFRVEGERSAMILDGDKHNARIPHPQSGALLPAKAITVEAWTAIERTTEWGSILSAAHERKGWVLGFRQSNFSFGVATLKDGKPELSFSRAPDSLEWGRWHHVAGTYDGSALNVYVNGRLEDSIPVSGEIQYAEAPDILMGTFVDESNVFASQMWVHEAAVFDRALSEEEIRARFEAKKGLIPEVFQVKVGPYLERIDRETILVRWETEAPSPSVLLYGLELPVQNRIEDLTPKTQHELALTGIEPRKMYSYRIEFLDEKGRLQSTRLHELDATFDFAPVKTAINEEAFPPTEEGDKLAALAEEILDRIGTERGYCLIPGPGEGRLAFELAKRSQLKILCLEKDADRVQGLRASLDQAGLYGVRATVHHRPDDSLPYAPYLANLIVSENLLLGREFTGSPEEILKVLRPEGGTAYLPKNWADHPALKDRSDLQITTTDHPWIVVRRGSLPGAGVWTHQYGDAGNTSNSHDELVMHPLEALWYGEPGPRPMTDRGTRSPAPLSIHGRLFIQADRRLFGLDAYNGTMLWEREIPDLRRANVPRDAANQMAKGHSLYVAIRDRLWELDGQTGDLMQTFPVVRPENDLTYDWGCVVDGGPVILGTAVRRGGLFIGADGEWYDDPNEESDKVTSDNLFGIDPAAVRTVWIYERGRIINSTLSAGDGSVYFIETRSPEAVGRRSARLHEKQLFTDQWMVCLDASTGEVKWEKPVEFEGGEWVFYLSYFDGFLATLATTQDFHLHVFDARDGSPLWKKSLEMRRDHHGGAMQHPVIARGNIYCDSLAFDLRTGNLTHENLPERRGCGTMSGAENALFFRHHFHSVWNLDTDERVQYEGLRSGCWLGIIPAGGLLLAPESSAGCYCADPIQTTIAFLPTGGPQQK